MVDTSASRRAASTSFFFDSSASLSRCFASSADLPCRKAAINDQTQKREEDTIRGNTAELPFSAKKRYLRRLSVQDTKFAVLRWARRTFALGGWRPPAVPAPPSTSRQPPPAPLLGAGRSLPPFGRPLPTFPAPSSRPVRLPVLGGGKKAEGRYVIVAIAAAAAAAAFRLLIYLSKQSTRCPRRRLGVRRAYGRRSPACQTTWPLASFASLLTSRSCPAFSAASSAPTTRARALVLSVESLALAWLSCTNRCVLFRVRPWVHRPERQK